MFIMIVMLIDVHHMIVMFIDVHHMIVMFINVHHMIVMFINVQHMIVYSYLMGVDAIDQSICPEVLGMTNCSIA